MALNKLKFNSLNVTPTASKAIGFNSSANGLEATLSGGAMTFIKNLLLVLIVHYHLLMELVMLY